MDKKLAHAQVEAAQKRQQQTKVSEEVIDESKLKAAHVQAANLPMIYASSDSLLSSSSIIYKLLALNYLLPLSSRD